MLLRRGDPKLCQLVVVMNGSGRYVPHGYNLVTLRLLRKGGSVEGQWFDKDLVFYGSQYNDTQLSKRHPCSVPIVLTLSSLKKTTRQSILNLLPLLFRNV